MNIQKSKGLIYFCALMLIIGMHLFADSPPRSLTLRIGINAFPVSLNPVYATNETSQAIVNKVFNGLFYFDPKGRIQNQLVKNFHIVNKNNNPQNPQNEIDIVIQLKKNIFFPDGKELSSEDVLQTINLLLDRRFKYPYLSTLQFIKAWEKIDGYRFKITLSHPVATWKNELTFKILNANEIKDVSPQTFKNMVLSGTGPYKIKTIKGQSKIILELNDANTAAKSGKAFRYIEYSVITYTHLSPLKLINNEIDICELQPENVEAYKHSRAEKWRESFRILKYKKFGYTYLVFNLRNSLITKDLRDSFYNILVHGDFLDRFLKDRGERVLSPFLLLSPKVKPMPFKTTPLQTPIHLKILTNSESKLRKELVLFLREEFKPYKILLQPVFLEYHSFLEYLKKGRFDMAISGFTLNIDYDMMDIFSSDSYFNYSHFQDAQMDALLAEGLREMDLQKREEIYLEAHRLWLEHLPLIPLFNLYYYVGISRNIEVPAQAFELVGAVGDFLFNILQWKRNE